MRRRIKIIVVAVGVTALAVVGMDAGTYAGTGDSLILGKFNKSKQTTQVKNTGKGPALSLHAKGKRPALAVDSRAKIVRLNADRIDGRDASSLLTRARVFTKSHGAFTYGVASFTMPKLSKGTYLASYSVTMKGTAMTDVGAAPAGRCRLQSGSGPSAAVTTSGYSGYHDIALSGSAVITVGPKPWRLVCTADHPERAWGWSIDPNYPVQVSFLRIDRKTTGQLHTGSDRGRLQ